MRWRVPEPSRGDRRVSTAFLWWPMTIEQEARWLERASWVEEYCTSKSGYYWRPLWWVD